MLAPKHVAVGLSKLDNLDPQTKIIPEADAYRLIMKSTLPKALGVCVTLRN